MSGARAIVVLGCKLAFDANGALDGAAKRRVDMAAKAWNERAEDVSLIVVSGGPMWNGVVEADALERALVERGVPKEKIVRERYAAHTGENARFSAALLRGRGIEEILLVTCDWHLPRARRLFERTGLRVRGVPAPSPRRSLKHRVWRWGRERVAEWLTIWAVVALVVGLTGCHKSQDATPQVREDAGAPAEGIGLFDPPEFTLLARAENRRRAADVTEDMIGHGDVRVRRRAARALSRIADDAAEPALVRLLEDKDGTVAAWAAYGLGYTCKGREDAHVAMLVKRGAALSGAAPDEGELDARWAIARAVGRCGGAAGEAALVAWLRERGPSREHGPWMEDAAYGLGDIATKGGALSRPAIDALLMAASGDTTGWSGSHTSSLRAAFFPLGRIKQVPANAVESLLMAAQEALHEAGPERIFVVRALSRAGGARELGKVAGDRSFTAAERAEAARGLGQITDHAAREAAADTLKALSPSQDPMALMALAGDEFGVILSLLESLHGEVPKGSEPALLAFAQLNGPGELPPVLGARLAALRCAAAGAIAKDDFQNELLAHCGTKGTIAFERARLAVVLRKPLTGARRAAWVELTNSANMQVREAALEAAPAHPELGDAARAALVSALRSGKAGLVDTAADAIHQHPPRPDAALNDALAEALAHLWAEDLVETRMGLIDAAVALHHPKAQEAALRACKDPNVTLREHAIDALVSLKVSFTRVAPAADAGRGALQDACKPDEVKPAAELEHLIAHPVKLTLETDAGRLTMTLDPTLAPVTATRIANLAESGFFKEMRVHRVVPGYVVQFGDPGGDGYGGSGQLLRCETSPVTFEPLSVGMALAGRDTGSSQVFVTLARTANLDGNYTIFGRAEGDWAAVAQDDVIHDVRVER